VSLARRTRQVPLVMHVHGMMDEYWKHLGRWMRPKHQNAYRQADRLVAVSSAVANLLRTELDLAVSRRIDIVPNGVNIPEGPADPEKVKRLREKLAIEPGMPVVGLVARPARAKRHTDFVEAAAILHNRYPDVRFVVVGDGKKKYVDEFLDAVKKHHLEAVVLWEGEQRDLEPYYALFDAGVLCSEREGCSLVLLEYLAHGLPVVGTDIPAIREVIASGQNGILAPVRSPMHLAACIERVLCDDNTAERLRKAGRESAGVYTWDATTERLIGIYGKILPTPGETVVSR
jgi:glycosyltransferase involved in cell wall biosynthesis